MPTPNVMSIEALAERYHLDSCALQGVLDDLVLDGRATGGLTINDGPVWFVVEADGWFCRWVRVSLGLTQSQLGETLEVSQSLISAWEKGAGIPESKVRQLRRMGESIDESDAA